jgi:hypothetical protein
MGQCQKCNAMVNEKWAACLVCGCPVDGCESSPIESEPADTVEYPVAIQMDSLTLGATVDLLLWPDRTMVDGTPYNKQELADLISRDISAADLRIIHNVKREFNGEMEGKA